MDLLFLKNKHIEMSKFSKQVKRKRDLHKKGGKKDSDKHTTNFIISH